MPKADRKTFCAAFTLLEVMAVVLLIGLAASATIWSMTDNVRSYSAANVASAIEGADNRARMAARRFTGDVRLVFDLDRQNIYRSLALENSPVKYSHSLKLPENFRLDTVIDACGSEHNFGAIAIPFSRWGLSQNYAVRLAGNNTALWLVFCGSGSGSVTIDSDEDVYKLFEKISSEDTACLDAD